MITQAGISLKKNGTRRGFSWKKLDAQKGSALQVGAENVPWEEVQAELDEAGIDLASTEIQDKIAAQEQAILDAEPTQEEKDITAKRNQLADEIRNNPTPSSMPELTERVHKLEQLLGAKPIEL